MCSMRTLTTAATKYSKPISHSLKSWRIIHCILRIITLNCSWPISEIHCVVLASDDDPRYADFVSCSTSEVELILVLPSQNDCDALKYVACVTFSRILQDHRFPTNVFLTSVDDVCPNQIYNCPARNFSFIMEIIHLLVLIRCPNSGKYSPCAQSPNRMQNSTLLLLGAFRSSFRPWTGPSDSPSRISKILVVFVTATDLAAAATQATYLEAATAELQNRYRR